MKQIHFTRTLSRFYLIIKRNYSSSSSIKPTNSINIHLNGEDNFINRNNTFIRQTSILDKYDNLIKTNQIKYDSKQFEVLIILNQFYNNILNYEPKRISKFKFFKNLFQKFEPKIKQAEIKSIYLHGGVGCGKTMLMDLVFNTIPETKPKLRIHFNKFMLNVHQNIHNIKLKQEHKNNDPIQVLSDELISQINFLFFDEFQVTDIADAMLMSRLFTGLFERGMIVFFTSNRVPTDLYKNGLQRELFEPFIQHIFNYCNVICLDSDVDYRKLSNKSQNRVYFNCDYEKQELDNLINHLVGDLNKFEKKEIEILGRKVKLDKTHNRVLDTNYSFVCEEARSSVDYLEFCKLFDVIVMRDVPFIDMKSGDTLRRFISFIDSLYDNNIRLICSGKASSPQYLFNLPNRELNKNEPSSLEDEHFAINRTISRLIDMQSENYLKKTKNFL